MGGGNGGMKSSGSGKGRHREGRWGAFGPRVAVPQIVLQGLGYLIGDKVRGQGAVLAVPGEMHLLVADWRSEDMMFSVFQKLRIQWGTGGGTVCNWWVHITISKAKGRRSSRVSAGRKYGPEFSSDAEGDGPEEEAGLQRWSGRLEGHSKEEKLLGFHAGVFRKGEWLLTNEELEEWKGGLPGWKRREYKRLDKGRLAQKATLANVRKAERRNRRWKGIDLPVTPVWNDEVEEEGGGGNAVQQG